MKSNRSGDHTAWSTNRNLVIDLGAGVSMEFVLILPGTFTMGSDQSPLTNEKPAHRIAIPEPFYLGKYEVTQEQWAAVMNETPAIHKGPQFPESARCPVENVSWRYARVFLAKLKEKARGYEFRLPTEEEWEFACRAGSASDYSFDDAAAVGEYAWYSGNSNGRTHPVGGKRPNAWGLYDMHGNVWEWCEDVFAPYPPGPGTVPKTPDPTAPRVLRGGAYNSLPKHARSAYRHDLLPDDSGRFYGLRCAAVSRKVR